MDDSLRILGVPMRQVLERTPDNWELNGVRLSKHNDHSGEWFFWQVHIVPGFCVAATCDTEAEAIENIEHAITRIREAARKLGT